ncbi:NUDIX hydrolase [Streptomyces sp. NPDC058045]|uniref:NUDIX hydrolase n=1 Tax=Streptomyces sp. NPDC058045 TaxID=3346311 RepID=UPI0036E151CA
MLIPWPSALVAAGDPATVAVAEDGTWTGTVALVNEWSADGRMLALADGADIDVRPLPLPVTVQYVTGPGHDGATVGLMTLDEVWQDGHRVMGRGRIDVDDPQGAALARKIDRGFLRFVSADIDQADGRVVCVAEDGTPVDGCDPAEDGTETGEMYTSWRIMGASLLAHPAFPEAQIALAENDSNSDSDDIVGYNPAWGCVRTDGDGGWETADCTDDDAVPAGPDGAPYDPEGQDEGAPTHAGLAVKALDTGRVLLIQRALDDDDPASGTWEFPGGSIEDGEDPEAAAFREFAEETGIVLPDTVTVVDGWRSENGVYQGYVATVPAEMNLAINPDADDRAVLNPDDPDGDMLEAVAWWDIDALPDMPALREEARATPWQLLSDAGDDDRAVVAAAFRYDGWTPPTDWFRAPDLPDLQPVTVDDDGRLRGYLAAWGVSHRSYPGRSITPPRSRTKYRLFNSRPLATSEGLVDVGLITMGTGHAALGCDRRAAAAHYDDTGTMAAVVRAGEDSRGIWLAGAVLPTLSDEQRLRLSLSRFSGDWRQEGAGLELVAALAVNTEGFPVPERRRGDQGDYALVAAGAVLAPSGSTLPMSRADVEALAEEVLAVQERRGRAAAAAGRVQQVRVQAAARRLRAPHVARLAADGSEDDDPGGFAPFRIRNVRQRLQNLQINEADEAFVNNLEEYWKRGAGAARIRWGTPGDWTRCHRFLIKHVGDERARRICSEWHHDVTGLWPGDSRNP